MTLSFPRPIPRRASATLLLAAVAAGAPPSETPGVSVAATPPMGWSSWNTFEKNIDEKLIRQSVHAIVSSGLKDAGYQYVNIDDGWQSATRGQDGNLQSDPQRFPGGMKVLGDYIHSKGSRFGIYTSAGVKICMRYEGSYNFEEQDTRQFAAWGVDFVKVDWCCTHPKHLEDRKCPRDERQDYALGGQEEIYKRWRAAFAKVDRPIVLSICEWGLGKPWLWGEGVGNMWRTTMDILPCRDCKKSWWAIGWERILDQQAGLERYAGPATGTTPICLSWA
jgi:alpha-galactosidase